jgi:hypothetical protein
MSTKLKEKEYAEIVQSILERPSQPIPKDLKEKQASRKEFWKESLTILQNEKFNSIDDAVERVVELSLSKLGENYNNNEEMKELIIDSIKSDPVMLEQLKQVLNIG